jgi:hypothetical protein
MLRARTSLTAAALTLCRGALFTLAAVLVVATPAGADNPNLECKPAFPAHPSKCNKDAQCCAGLVCQGGVCQAGCHIGGAFYASGARNPSNQC